VAPAPSAAPLNTNDRRLIRSCGSWVGSEISVISVLLAGGGRSSLWRLQAGPVPVVGLRV